MLEIVSWFVIFFVTHLLDCYVFSRLSKEKFVLNKKLIILSIIFAILDSFSNINNGLLKFVMTNLSTFIILKTVYNKSISKTLIGTLFTYIGYVIAELVFAILFLLIFNFDSNYFIDNFAGKLFVNIFDFIIYLLIFKIKYINKFIINVMKWYEENKLVNLLFRTFIVLILCYFVIYTVSFANINNNLSLLILGILFGIILFIAGYFNEKSGNNKLNVEYKQLLDYVKTYEDEVVDKSKKQHEYKNQLIIIDDMIPKTNKKAKEYLKKLLNNVEDVTDNDWLVKLKNLPSGGLKGLVHFKIKKMISNNISVYVDIDKNLSKKENWKNVDKNLEDISRVLGVYFDNAIEASSKADNKLIVIEFKNNDDNIEFALSNSYNGNINFNELDKEGYTTKGKGRGVGLPLVKDIIENNKILSQKRGLTGQLYVQKLYIKK